MKRQKPFNLEEALSGNATVVTRDGREVKDFSYLKHATDGSDTLVGTVDGILETWREDGRYLEGEQGDLDLFLEVKIRTVRRAIVLKRAPIVSGGDYYLEDAAYEDLGPINNPERGCQVIIELEVDKDGNIIQESESE